MTIFRYTNRGVMKKMGGELVEELDPIQIRECEMLSKKKCEGMLAKIGCKLEPAIVGLLVLVLALMLFVWMLSSGFNDYEAIPRQLQEELSHNHKFAQSRLDAVFPNNKFTRQGVADHKPYMTYNFPGNFRDDLGAIDQTRQSFNSPFGQGAGQFRSNVDGSVHFLDGQMSQVAEAKKGSLSQSDNSNGNQYNPLTYLQTARSRVSQTSGAKSDGDLQHQLYQELSPHLGKKGSKLSTQQPSSSVPTLVTSQQAQA